MTGRSFYTVRGKTMRAAASGAAAENWARAAAASAHWANVLALVDSAGNRAVGKAVLSLADTSLAGGECARAVYGATVYCPAGRYVRVALCSDENGRAEVSAAAIDFTSVGEDTEITAETEVLLHMQTGMTLCGGADALVRRLLGCGDTAAWQVRWGRCAYPARMIARNGELMEGSVPVLSQADGVVWKMTGNGGVFGKEVFLFAGEKAALRAVRPWTENGRTVTATADGNALLLSEETERVTGVRADGVDVLRVDACRAFDCAYVVREENSMSLVGTGKMKSDPDGKYAALIGENFVQVYGADSLDLVPLLRVELAGGESVEICRGGSLAVWGSTQLTIYERDESGTYDSFSVTTQNGSERVIVREGERYHAAYRRSAIYFRLEVTRAGATVAEQVRVTTALFFAGRCGDAIVFGDRTLKARTLGGDVSGEFCCDGLGTRSVVRTQSGTGEGFAVCDEKGVTVVYDYVHNTTTEMSEQLTANGRLLIGTENIYIFDWAYGVRKLSGNADFSGVTDACAAGDGVFVLRGSTAEAYYGDGTGVAVRLPYGSAGKMVDVDVVERTVKENGGFSFSFM